MPIIREKLGKLQTSLCILLFTRYNLDSKSNPQGYKLNFPSILNCKDLVPKQHGSFNRLNASFEKEFNSMIGATLYITKRTNCLLFILLVKGKY